MSDSNQHNNYPLPTTIVGGGMGLLKGNNHIKVEDRMPLANVHLTLLNTMGIDTGSLGDSNGMVPEILA
jgi:hypothetical protein